MLTFIRNIDATLVDVFARLSVWFEKPAEVRSYRPANEGWTIDEVLEHIGLTNHFLLILVDKGAKKALNRLAESDLQHELDNYSFGDAKLEEVALHKSFEWMRPEHMEPTGEKSLAEVRAQLQTQLEHCRDVLSRLPNGEGILYKTTMSVNNLGKINVYEYVYFIAQHAERHITQMQKVEREATSGIDQVVREDPN